MVYNCGIRFFRKQKRVQDDGIRSWSSPGGKRTGCKWQKAAPSSNNGLFAEAPERGYSIPPGGEWGRVAGLVFILHSPLDDTRWKSPVIFTDAQPALLKTGVTDWILSGRECTSGISGFPGIYHGNTPHAEVFPARKRLISDIPGFPSPMLVTGISHFQQCGLYLNEKIRGS